MHTFAVSCLSVALEKDSFAVAFQSHQHHQRWQPSHPSQPRVMCSHLELQLGRANANDLPVSVGRCNTIKQDNIMWFNRRTQRSASVLSMASDNPSNQQKIKNDLDGGGGSILGASLIFGGTAVGAGMLALPAETIDAGFVPTIFGLILCWMFTFVTSLVVLEASWLSTCVETCGADNEGRSGGFLSISRMALGRPGEILTAILFWFLLTAIIVAYTSEGGQLVSQGVKEVALIEIAPAIGSLIFATFFASLATVGTSRVDTINRVFVLGLVATFIGLVGTGLSMVTISNLLDHSDWKSMYPTVISIGILSFGAQNVVPTLLRYLDNDPMKARQAILFGSLMPLFLYTIWEAVFLGAVGTSVSEDGNKMEVMSVLGQTGGSIVGNFVEVFSICAIGSSMAGASVSLVDFFQDALEVVASKEEMIDEPKSLSVSVDSTRLVAAALALLPPVVIAYAFPDVFLIALEKAGLLGGVSLYGVIPALSILSLRKNYADESESMPGRLGGGNAALVVLAVISTALLLPEIANLFP